MAREDLNPVEEARACAALVEELGLTREEVGRRVGRSRVAVSNLIRLLDLPDEALELLERGELSEGHGRALLLAEGPRRAPPPRARRGRARAGRCASWSAARATPSSAAVARRAPRRRGAASRPGGGRRARSPTPSARARRRGPGRARTATATASQLAFDSLDEALAAGARASARAPPDAPR